MATGVVYVGTYESVCLACWRCFHLIPITAGVDYARVSVCCLVVNQCVIGLRQ